MTDWLLGTLLWTSVLAIVVLAVREPVRRQFGARAAYALWLLPAARFMMPVMSETVERTVPAASPATPMLLGGGPMIATEAHLLASVDEVSIIDQFGGWPVILTVVWLSVAFMLFSSKLASYRRDRQAILDQSTLLAHIGGIRLVRSPAVRCPMAFGLIDRVIAVPVDFDRRYNDRERCLALDHELSHHRSGDMIANAIAFVLLCLQWFNPLAWAAHSAFRFDQEAACDARVLDKAVGPDREQYGRAIAKAASGRALLFAATLDRPSTIHRRLKSMTITNTQRRRLAGLGIVAAAVVVALPLTATRAIEYRDVQAPTPPAAPSAPSAMTTPLPPAAPVAPAAPLLAAAAVTAPTPPTPPQPPVAPSIGRPDIGFVGNEMVTIHGRTKRWSELSASDRAEISRATREAHRELARSRANMERDMARARIEMEKFHSGEFEREMAEARVEMEEALREIERNAADLRRHSVDPEKLKAEIRRSMREVEKIDVAKIRREAMASVNPDEIRRSLEEAERSLDQVDDRLEALEDRDDD